jgi:hypothetical protein
LIPKPPKEKESDSCFLHAEAARQHEQRCDRLVQDGTKIVGVGVPYWTEDSDKTTMVPHPIELGDSTDFDLSGFEYKVHEICLLMTGDLMYLATIHGKEHLTGKRCFYCMSLNALWNEQRMREEGCDRT